MHSDTLLHPATQTAFDRAAARLDQLDQLPPGPELYIGLIALQAIPLGSAAAVRAHALWVKQISHCHARSMVTTGEAVTGIDLLVNATGHEATQIIGEELAAMTHITSGVSTDHVRLVEQIGATLPTSWEALDSGELTFEHVRQLAKSTQRCERRVAHAVDAQLVPLAVERCWTPQKLAKEAEKAIIRIDPEGAADRAAKAKERADVRLFPGQDETAVLVADGDAVTLQQVMDAIDARAAALKQQYQDLPIGACRFNALANLVLGEPAAVKPAVEVAITMDLTTWLGLNENPGELSGFGPISAETARALAQDASFRRLLTDPLTAQTLDLGTRRYRPSEPLRRFVAARDKTCQFPGCARRAIRCDIDHCTARNHRDPESGGRTDAKNLHSLCRRHHNLKTKKLWHVDINPDGSELWTSALGFTYRKPAANYPIELLEPPADVDVPPQTEAVPEHDPDPPFADDPYPTPPPLTDDEFSEFLDAIDRGFGAFAERAYDVLRTANLIG
jgi:Domain of unknown function (DUF222)